MENHVKRNIVCALLSAVVLIIFGILANNYIQKTSETQSKLEAAVAEAKPYEDELTELKRSISSAADDLSDTSDTARFVIGYVIRSGDDITYAEEQSEQHGFEPVLIIDCIYDLTELESLATVAAASGHEIMLTASVFTVEANEKTKSLLSYMSANGIECSDIFLLRNDYYSDSNVDMIIGDGFAGYTVYNSSPTAGITDDGYITCDYSYLTTDSSSYTRFSSSYSNLASMVIAIDRDAMRSGTLTEGFITTLLSTLTSYSENENCEYATISEVREALIEDNESMEEKWANYEAYVAECEERIEELEEIIAEIYAKYD